jgi:NAD(P)-binding Rossmann-like domain
VSVNVVSRETVSATRNAVVHFNQIYSRLPSPLSEQFLPAPARTAQHVPRNRPPPHPISAIIIGGGPRGVTPSICLVQRVDNLTLTIYDSQPHFGATWASHVYPGVSCDIPALCYRLTFEPNVKWNSMFPPGEGERLRGIGALWQGSVAFMNTRSWDVGLRARSGIWRGKWRVGAEDLVSDSTVQDNRTGCSFVPPNSVTSSGQISPIGISTRVK